MSLSPVTTITDELLAEIEAAAASVGAMALDTAEVISKAEDGQMIECPVCGGEGYASAENDYCNFDNTAIGVEFYGIGPEFGAAEKYFRAAKPANVRAIITELRTLRAENADLVEVMRDIRRQIDGNIRPTVRDCINGMPDHNDIYDYCDAIEAAIDASIQEQP